MRYLAAAFLILFGSGVYAAPAIVRAGEHGQFTRIVIENPSLSEWGVSQNGSEIKVSIVDLTEGFDVSRLFERITNSRVLQTKQENNSLIIKLNCNCVFERVSMPKDLIVVDIKSNPNLPDLPTSFEALQQSQITVPAEFRIIDVLGNQGWSTENDSVPNPPERIPAKSQIEVSPASSPSPIFPAVFPPGWSSSESVQPNQTSIDQDGMSQLSNRRQTLIDAMAEQLAFDLSVATTRGVLEVSGLQSQVLMQLDGDEVSENGVNVSLKGDKQNSTNLGGAPEMGGSQCAPKKFFDIANWHEGNSLSEQLSNYRNLLYGEFDRVNRDALVSLAKSYVYFGFGSEAIQLLSSVGELKTREYIILMMAHIVENSDLEEFQKLSQQVGCSPDQTFWAIMVSDSPVTEKSLAEAAVLSLSTFPVHLKTILGPRLSNKLRSSGFVSLAQQVLRAVDRSGMEQVSSVVMEEAEVAAIEGEVSQAQNEFERVVMRDDLESPRALIGFVLQKHKAGGKVSEDTVLLIDSFVGQYRNSKISKELEKIRILAQAMTSKYEDAFRNLGKGTFDNDTSEALINDIYDYLAKEPSDIRFLRIFLDRDRSEVDFLDSQTREELILRMQELGFLKATDLNVSISESTADLSISQAGRTDDQEKQLDGTPARVDLDLENGLERELEASATSDQNRVEQSSVRRDGPSVVSLQNSAELLDEASNLRQELLSILR